MVDSPKRAAEKNEEKQYDEYTIQVDRVARVVKGGRRFRFRALVVVGDKKGKVGVGSAKGADVTAAVNKASDIAKKHFVKIITYKGTLPHEVEAKVSGAKILIKPAAPGTGLIAGGVLRTVLEAAGIQNALSKSFGSSNKTNLAYATVKALESMVPASKWTTNIDKNTKPKVEAKEVKKVEKTVEKKAEKKKVKK